MKILPEDIISKKIIEKDNKKFYEIIYQKNGKKYKALKLIKEELKEKKEVESKTKVEQEQTIEKNKYQINKKSLFIVLSIFIFFILIWIWSLYQTQITSLFKNLINSWTWNNVSVTSLDTLSINAEDSDSLLVSSKLEEEKVKLVLSSFFSDSKLESIKYSDYTVYENKKDFLSNIYWDYLFSLIDEETEDKIIFIPYENFSFNIVKNNKKDELSQINNIQEEILFLKESKLFKWSIFSYNIKLNTLTYLNKEYLNYIDFNNLLEYSSESLYNFLENKSNLENDKKKYLYYEMIKNTLIFNEESI